MNYIRNNVMSLNRHRHRNDAQSHSLRAPPQL